MAQYHSASGSVAEDLFIDLFADTFGAEKAGYLYSQYHFYDIYQNSRYADFVLENGARRVAIEIDDETSHNKSLVTSNKFYDDLLKQNSMVYLGWDVYRWAVRQMQIQPEAVKDELRVFLGSHPQFREIEDYLPTQRGKALNGTNLELKEHQKEALKALEKMRANRETIALLYHATGTGKLSLLLWMQSAVAVVCCFWRTRRSWSIRRRILSADFGLKLQLVAIWRQSKSLMLMWYAAAYRV